MHLNMSSAKWRPFCHALNVLSGTNHVSASLSLFTQITAQYMITNTDVAQPHAHTIALQLRPMGLQFWRS